MSEAECVVLSEREGNYWLTLNRPEVLNAINEPMVDGFLRVLDGIRYSGRPLIITGAGRAFSAGGDLNGYLSKLSSPVSMARAFDKLAQLLLRLADYPSVTIAAVNGVAVAGGLEILCICDLAVAAESARFADGHINYGLHPGGGSTALLGRLIGERRARWLLLSGEFIGAQEAEQIGLVNRTVRDGELELTANAMAAAVARHAQPAVTRTKKLMRSAIEEVLRAEHASLLDHFRDPETLQRLQVFAARSKPEPDS